MPVGIRFYNRKQFDERRVERVCCTSLDENLIVVLEEAGRDLDPARATFHRESNLYPIPPP
jgi:hypothetical protein